MSAENIEILKSKMQNSKSTADVWDFVQNKIICDEVNVWITISTESLDDNRIWFIQRSQDWGHTAAVRWLLMQWQDWLWQCSDRSRLKVNDNSILIQAE